MRRHQRGCHLNRIGDISPLSRIQLSLGPHIDPGWQVRDAVREASPSSPVVPFGSSTVGLMLPGVSDLDLAVFDDSAKKKLTLKIIMRKLRKNNLVCTHSPVLELLHARVPILKFRERKSGLQVDICLNQHDGLQTTCSLAAELVTHRKLAPLILVLKAYLQENQWNDTVNGGVGSYLLYVMALRELEGGAHRSLSDLLVSFLCRFGNARLAQHNLRNPVNGNSLGAAAHRFDSDIAAGFRKSAKELAHRNCLSALLVGWPAKGILSTVDELGTMLAQSEFAVAAARKKGTKLSKNTFKEGHAAIKAEIAVAAAREGGKETKAGRKEVEKNLLSVKAGREQAEKNLLSVLNERAHLLWRPKEGEVVMRINVAFCTDAGLSDANGYVATVDLPRVERIVSGEWAATKNEAKLSAALAAEAVLKKLAANAEHGTLPEKGQMAAEPDLERYAYKEKARIAATEPHLEQYA